MEADKVQKIREELARLKEETSIGLSEHENGVEQGRMEIIDAISIFLDSMQEEPVSEDFEEAVNAYIGYAPEVDECSSVYGKRKAFKAGANWQRSQLLRNAIEVVISDDTTICNAVELMKLQEKYQGQKVKIAIIKEE